MSSYGEDLLALVQQDETWRTPEGEVVLVESMTPRHLAAVLRVLVAIEAELFGAWRDRQQAEGAPVEESTPEEVRRWFDGLALVARVRALLGAYNDRQRAARYAAGDRAGGPPMPEPPRDDGAAAVVDDGAAVLDDGAEAVVDDGAAVLDDGTEDGTTPGAAKPRPGPRSRTAA